MSEPKSAASPILTEVADYYSKRLAQYGVTPQGVDWNSQESQFLRFEQLCAIIDTKKPFRVNDLGCGYAAMFDFLSTKATDFEYAGQDISDSMIKAAGERLKTDKRARFEVAGVPQSQADYGIASGIFNVRQLRSNHEWLEYIKATLDALDCTSNKGFAFNCLTIYSDPPKMRDYLYYADPCALFDWCKRRYSKRVSLFHDYELYEFTIHVKKNL